MAQLDSLDALKDAYDTGELLRRLKSERAPKKDIALAKKVLAKKAVTDWLRTRANARTRGTDRRGTTTTAAAAEEAAASAAPASVQRGVPAPQDGQCQHHALMHGMSTGDLE